MQTRHPFQREIKKLTQAAKAQANLLWQVRWRQDNLTTKQRRRFAYWGRVMEKWRPAGNGVDIRVNLGRGVEVDIFPYYS